MNYVVRLYHGNRDANMRPAFGVGVPYRDFGVGFYTTPNMEMGREWAYFGYSQCKTGYLHTYTMDLSALRVLDFTKLNGLCWLAELMHNRHVNIRSELMRIDMSVFRDNIDMLEIKYRVPDIDDYDAIIGYRADDCHFAYAIDFVQGTRYIDNLDLVLQSGTQDLQICIKSEKAFSMLRPVDNSPEVVPIEYAEKWRARDIETRRFYSQCWHSKDKILIRDCLWSGVYEHVEGKTLIRDYLQLKGIPMLEGENKKNSYDLFWLKSDMDNMGFLFEYCDEYALEVFHVSGTFDKIKFMTDFMQSDLRYVMECGHPNLLSEAAVNTFEKYINIDCNGDIKQYMLDNYEDAMQLNKDQALWVGSVYAYVHYQEDMRSSDLIRVLPLEYMLGQFHTGSGMDIPQFYERLKPVIQENLKDLK